MSFADEYVEYWDSNLKGIPYQYEPLLMQERQFEDAMRSAKRLSWQLYDKTKKLHKKFAKQNKMIKIIGVDLIGSFENGALEIRFVERDISKLDANEKSAQAERIKAYRDNHPEKCYLNKLLNFK